MYSSGSVKIPCYVCRKPRQPVRLPMLLSSTLCQCTASGLRLEDSNRKTSKLTHVLARLGNGTARSQPLDGEFPSMSLANSTFRAILHNKNITRLCH
jgi:hypothetical protein